MEYKLFEHNIISEGKIRKSYGIAAVSGGKVCESYPDVSLGREKVERLVNLLNDYEVSLVHLKDIIEDFYCDNC